ncbi:hypothetical protein [Sporosarcina highlanderae]|uniref:Uncharacterized protein n=1 Tax=Sporosarcina highlanderae TaxID=3035916 RepID=A0ABT8JST8_9BACL|nr:hypothetical protein [Sporosarcina highlanderae]MDN4608175.1 hypothetical protein [Sporosarcina highlanderae]
MKPVIEDSFATLSIQDYSVHPVYGIGHDLKVGKEVPSYKEVKTGVELSIRFKDAWTEENEEKLIAEVASFIERAHSKGIKNISMRFFLQDKVMEDGRINTFSILIEDIDLSTIQTKEDVKKYITTF